MEVVEASCSLLTNAEVLEVVREVKGTMKKKKGFQTKPLNTLLYQTAKYLKSVETSRPSEAELKTLVSHCESLHLTQAEILQILNTRPTTPVEIQLVVEESEERLDESKIQTLIEVILKNLPPPPKEPPPQPQKSPKKKKEPH